MSHLQLAADAAHWLARLDDTALRSRFGSSTVDRGWRYQQSNRVRSMLSSDGGRTIVANVTGSNGRTYVTLVHLDGPPPMRSASRCTCPMTADCKHVVTVLLHARSLLPAQDRPQSPWRSLLDPLVSGPDPGGAPLGVQVHLARRRSSTWAPAGGTLSVRLRPVTTGKRGGWIKTGANWDDVIGACPRLAFDPSQLAPIREMAMLAQARSHYRHPHDGLLPAEEVGPALWRLLRQAVTAGVPLLPGEGIRGPVSLDEGTARIELSARGDEDGAVVEPVVLHAGAPTPIEQITWVGSPPTGLALSRGDEDNQLEVVLIQLESPMGHALNRLIQHGPVQVPSGDLPELTAMLPDVDRFVPVRTHSPQLAAPQVGGPFLAVAVSPQNPPATTDQRGMTQHSAQVQHSTVVQVGWLYEVNEEPVVAPLYGEGPRVPGRDRQAEEHLAASIAYLGKVQELFTPAPRHGAEAAGLRPDVTLQGMAAVRFHDQVLPELIADDRVRLSIDGALPDYRQAVGDPKIEVSATDSGDPGSTDWFDLGVTVTVDGEDVPFAPLFTALATGQEHLILESGTWFSLDRDELHALRALIEEARALQEPDSPGLRLTRLHAGLWEELVSLGVVTAQSAAWQSSVGALLELESTPAPGPPAGLAATLREYQQTGYQWLSVLWDTGLGGILADDMGLGKTVQTLAMVARARERGELDAPLLIVCPTTVIATWAEQSAQFTPDLRLETVTETVARRGRPLAEIAAKADIVVTSYTLLRIEQDEYHARQWAGIVLDEAQAVKNYRAKTYQSVRRVPARFRLAITGTPLENSLMDLWALLSIVAPGLYPDPARFTEEYRRPIESGSDPERLSRLRRRIRPLMLRRTKADVAPELPPKQEQVLRLDLTPAHQRVYSTHLQRERQRVLGMLDDVQKNRIAIFRSLTLLRQLSLAPGLIDDDYAAIDPSKLGVLMGHIRELAAEGHRALVFSQFTGFLKLVRQRLDAEGIGYAYLDGRTRNRDKRIAQFRHGGDPLFLISLKAGGFGLTLTEADYVFVLDPWWNPAAEEQAIDRTHRIGQDKTVMVYRLVAADTIEDKVVALQDRKRKLFADVVSADAEGAMSAPLSAADIRGLLEIEA